MFVNIEMENISKSIFLIVYNEYPKCVAIFMMNKVK